ncbi:longitudinals lacking protein, isoforms A/B/D/L-like [Belonocnema kinseyi]|uniref:longitudinals lacking protein, isoforms A/B/D/L-like n=1 Tax=Belonocnema kinseyi TaxID=2817044 RepID=UPI00143D52D7|nr:longitudinals lacking protein, isoforms A/B/D/L-like [Belonocnema kinseyi]
MGENEPEQLIYMQPDNHSRKRRKDPKGHYECDRCRRTYMHKKSFQRHKSYECDQAPRFDCNFCDYKSKRRHDLSKHMNTCRFRPNTFDG